MRELTRLLQRQHSTDQRPLWFVGFQEVVDELAATLVPAMELLGYTVYRQPGAPAYGCALAVHGSLTVTDRGWVPYDRTVMQRGFLYVRARPPGSPPHRQILFATTHLESFTGEEYTGAAQRPRQLRQMELFCNERMALDPSTAVAIITGDMNWDDERPRQGTPTTDPAMATVLSENWQDSWLATKSGWKDTCYTYDGKLNPMLSGNLRRRFDRCLVRSRAGVAAARATSTQLLGTEALPGLTWPKWNRWKQTSREMPTAPSDHFGFVATIQLNET
jgi:endonuclease/exonuclease/phosphatase family metal-dependent hydrolase